MGLTPLQQKSYVEYLKIYAHEHMSENWARVDVSRAISLGIDLAAPEGLAYDPHQKAGIALAIRDRHVLIADEPGVGKTMQAIGVLNNTNDTDRALFIVPSALKVNWEKELTKWLVPSASRPIIRIKGANDWRAVPSQGKVAVIANYEILRPKSRGFNEVRSHDWDIVVMDEVHRLKNPDAQQTIGILGDLGGFIKPIPANRKILMTGTPISRSPNDMFSALSYLDPVVWGSGREGKAAFQNRYVAFDGSKPVGAKNEENFDNRLRSTVLVRRRKDDVLTSLPPKRRKIIVLEPETAEERRAISAGNEAQAKYASMHDGLARGVIQGIGVHFTEISKIRHQTGLAKAPRVADYVKDVTDEGPLVVFSFHKDILDVISNKLEAAGIEHRINHGDIKKEEQQKNIDDFQAGDFDVFLGTLETAGEGVTLTRANRVIFSEQDWKSKLMVQAEDRLHRRGQEHDSVFVEYVVLENSLDNNIITVLNQDIDTIAGTVGMSDSARINRTEEEILEADSKMTRSTAPTQVGTFNWDETANATEDVREYTHEEIAAMRGIFSHLSGNRAVGNDELAKFKAKYDRIEAEEGEVSFKRGLEILEEHDAEWNNCLMSSWKRAARVGAGSRRPPCQRKRQRRGLSKSRSGLTGQSP